MKRIWEITREVLIALIGFIGIVILVSEGYNYIYRVLGF